MQRTVRFARVRHAKRNGHVQCAMSDVQRATCARLHHLSRAVRICRQRLCTVIAKKRSELSYLTFVRVLRFFDYFELCSPLLLPVRASFNNFMFVVWILTTLV